MGLLFCDRESKLVQSRIKQILDSLYIDWVSKQDYKIVTVAHQMPSTVQTFLNLPFPPKIENVMEIDVCK